MDGIVKHGSKKRDFQPITCGKEKTFRTVWREAELEDVFPKGASGEGRKEEEAGEESEGERGKARGGGWARGPQGIGGENRGGGEKHVGQESRRRSN